MSEETINDSCIEDESSRPTNACIFDSFVRCLHFKLVKEIADDERVVKACQSIDATAKISVVNAFNWHEEASQEQQQQQQQQQQASSENVLTVYVVDSFENVRYNGPNYRIVGCTALVEIAAKTVGRSSNERCPFDSLTKPLYCHALIGQVICFTGYRNREDVSALRSLVQFMGGKVQKDTNPDMTYLVAKTCKGEKFAYATLFGVPVVSDQWINDAWQNRHVVDFNATDINFVSKYQFKLFDHCKICFFGFAPDEKIHMMDVLKENGGESVDQYDDENCTHVVVDDTHAVGVGCSIIWNSNKKGGESSDTKPYVVKGEWFWSSIQRECRENEIDFKLERPLLCQNDVDNSRCNVSPAVYSLTNTSINTSSSGSQNRKRKRKKLLGNAGCNSGGGGGGGCNYNTQDSSPHSAQKRRSSTGDVSRLSENSFFDYTSSTSTVIVEESESECSLTAAKLKCTKRYEKVMELWQTETNYVAILRTIMTLFKGQLESMMEQKDELLNATEMKIIFGYLPPIYAAHCNMLEDLNQIVAKWNEDISIGKLVQKYSNDLVRAYPPFINFFENTRDMLIKCDKTKPRFHAFLKLCQTKPECGRQSLQDLLIRPVQRLPSINLLLNDILRNTPKTSRDHATLETAIEEIRRVMTYINEDKRKTEGQVALFDIFNDIEKCPADLVSSHRCFINRCEVTELSDDLSGKGNLLVLFLFSDVLEICKRKIKTHNKENDGGGGSSSSSSGSVNVSVVGSVKPGNGKLYKHIDLIPLSAIIKVIDIKETEDCHNIFALMIKRSSDSNEIENSRSLYSFTVTDSSVDKTTYLCTLCKQIANSVCRTDATSYLIQLEPRELDIDSSDVNISALGKAFNKFASKTRKVSRAFSFNKTPSKLKRAVSTMMSPFANQNGLTPSSQLANLQLVAIPSISNFSNSNVGLSTPTSKASRSRTSSIQKMKSSSFTMGSLRRL